MNLSLEEARLVAWAIRILCILGILSALAGLLIVFAAMSNMPTMPEEEGEAEDICEPLDDEND